MFWLAPVRLDQVVQDAVMRLLPRTDRHAWNSVPKPWTRTAVEPALNVISGVAGTPPACGTIGEVVRATWLVDHDLGHRWAPEENKPREPTFMPRKGYEAFRVFRLNPTLVGWAMQLSADTPLKDSESAPSSTALAWGACLHAPCTRSLGSQAIQADRAAFAGRAVGPA